MTSARAGETGTLTVRNSCVGDQEFEELLARNNCLWGISYTACAAAVATTAAAALLVRATNERAASRAATNNRPQLESALNQYTDSIRAGIIHSRQGDATFRQFRANIQEIAQLRREVQDLGDEADLGSNAKAARAGSLERIEELNEQNRKLEKDSQSAKERLEGILRERTEAKSVLTKRESTVWYFSDDEPFKKYDKGLGRLYVLFNRQAELKELEEKATSRLKNPRYESSNLAEVRRELKDVGEQIETGRKALVSARQDFEHMLHIRSSAGKYFLALGAGAVVATVSKGLAAKRCESENALLQSDSEIAKYFSLDVACRLRSNPQQMSEFAELNLNERNALLNKPKFCSAVKKYLAELREQQKFAQLDAEKTTCGFPRMIHYEVDGHKFVNKMEKLDNGNYRMTGSFIPDSQLSNDPKDPSMFQIILQQDKNGNLTPGTFKTRNPNWIAADLMQWSELSTRKTVLESPQSAGYPKPEERTDMGRPITNLMARLQESADRQWRAIQETAMTVAVGCASGLMGSTERSVENAPVQGAGTSK